MEKVTELGESKKPNRSFQFIDDGTILLFIAIKGNECNLFRHQQSRSQSIQKVKQTKLVADRMKKKTVAMSGSFCRCGCCCYICECKARKRQKWSEGDMVEDVVYADSGLETMSSPRKKKQCTQKMPWRVMRMLGGRFANWSSARIWHSTHIKQGEQGAMAAMMMMMTMKMTAMMLVMINRVYLAVNEMIDWCCTQFTAIHSTPKALLENGREKCRLIRCRLEEKWNAAMRWCWRYNHAGMRHDYEER